MGSSLTSAHPSKSGRLGTPARGDRLRGGLTRTALALRLATGAGVVAVEQRLLRVESMAPQPLTQRGAAEKRAEPARSIDVNTSGVPLGCALTTRRASSAFPRALRNRRSLETVHRVGDSIKARRRTTVRWGASSSSQLSPSCVAGADLPWRPISRRFLTRVHRRRLTSTAGGRPAVSPVSTDTSGANGPPPLLRLKNASNWAFLGVTPTLSVRTLSGTPPSNAVRHTIVRSMSVNVCDGDAAPACALP
jgi:hypothetical protein